MSMTSYAKDVFEHSKENEFGPARYAFGFLEGTHECSLNLGYYTSVYGLGETSQDVTIKGHVQVPNHLTEPEKIGALDNFWRSCEHFTMVPTGFSSGKPQRNAPDVVSERLDNSFPWRCSQASPLRDMVIRGNVALAEWQTLAKPGDPGQMWVGGFASGGYVSDLTVHGKVMADTQQQFCFVNMKLEGDAEWADGGVRDVAKRIKGGAWNFVALNTFYDRAPWTLDSNNVRCTEGHKFQLRSLYSSDFAWYRLEPIDTARL